MADAPAWMARVRQRVVTATDYFRGADTVFDVADSYFHGQVLEADAQVVPVAPGDAERTMLRLSLEADAQVVPVARGDAERTMLRQSLVALKDVSQYLDSAVVYMQAARILARAGSHLDQAEPAVMQGQRGAIARLRTACTVALDAYEVVDFCRGHMSAAIALLDGFGTFNAGVIDLVEQERQIVGPALSYAMEQYRVARDQAAAARQLLTEAP